MDEKGRPFERSSRREKAHVVGDDLTAADAVHEVLPDWRARTQRNNSPLKMLREMQCDNVLTGDRTSSQCYWAGALYCERLPKFRELLR
jgi:hypothetical protein